jgi:hypothetical protein
MSRLSLQGYNVSGMYASVLSKLFSSDRCLRFYVYTKFICIYIEYTNILFTTKKNVYKYVLIRYLESVTQALY